MLEFYVNSATPDSESCYSYAGGSVYPMESSDPEKTNHKLQWTKAVSKYFIVLFIIVFTFANHNLNACK